MEKGQDKAKKGKKIDKKEEIPEKKEILSKIIHLDYFYCKFSEYSTMSKLIEIWKALNEKVNFLIIIKKTLIKF